MNYRAVCAAIIFCVHVVSTMSVDYRKLVEQQQLRCCRVTVLLSMQDFNGNYAYTCWLSYLHVQFLVCKWDWLTQAPTHWPIHMLTCWLSYFSLYSLSLFRSSLNTFHPSFVFSNSPFSFPFYFHSLSFYACVHFSSFPPSFYILFVPFFHTLSQSHMQVFFISFLSPCLLDYKCKCAFVSLRKGLLYLCMLTAENGSC